VKNPNRSTGGGPATLEVPWRQGTGTLSARREHIIRLLVPLSRLPTLEVLSAELIASTERKSGPERTMQTAWTARVTIYVTPSNPDRIVLPLHRARVELTSESVQMQRIMLVSPDNDEATGNRLVSETVTTTGYAGSQRVGAHRPGLDEDHVKRQVHRIAHLLHVPLRPKRRPAPSAHANRSPGTGCSADPPRVPFRARPFSRIVLPRCATENHPSQRFPHLA